MTFVEQMAEWVVHTSFDQLSKAAREQIRIRILDALGCAIGALNTPTVRLIRAQLDEFGGKELCALVGAGRCPPDRAAFYNGALVRYLDFNDSYLARGETCHPSDNLSAVLAAAEYAQAGGRDLMTALAVAYQVQCRLSDVAPVRSKGFDHTVQGAYAVAAGVSKALGLDASKTANAIAISGTAYNALRVTRTGALSNWKGLAYPDMAFGATHAVFLAMRGITGPLEVFEGNKGFMDAIAGKFTLDWSHENLERVTRTIVKKFNAEVHSQSALEGILELVHEHGFKGAEVDRIEVDIFDVAFNIIGGGEEGDKTRVETKEQADHSLQYMVAAAVLDGQVMPEQYAPERIKRADVQDLLRRVVVRPNDEFSRRFPDEMPCRLTVTLRDGRILTKEKSAYEGFFTQPMRWDTVADKFDKLVGTHADRTLCLELIDAVAHLETIRAADLTLLLSQVAPTNPQPAIEVHD